VFFITLTMKQDYEILREAYSAWQAAESLRARRNRQVRYTFGDQWIDAMTDENGRSVPEREIILRTGRRPLTNNLLRRMVKTIVGIYRNRASENQLYDSTPGSLDARNCLAELDARLLEEYVISGCAIQRVADENRGGANAVWVDNVNPSCFFCNTFSDPRALDIELVGMSHDMSWPQLVNRFARGSRSKAMVLKKMVEDAAGAGFFTDEILGFSNESTCDFFGPAAPGRLRVFEIWRLKENPVTVRNRLRMDMKWHCCWITADGTVLDEYNSDFRHGSHPFVVKFYPLVDGEVHSFVEDAIDQQRNVNRLLVLTDTILAHSAKGGLIYPLNQLPRGMNLSAVESSWALPGAVIPVTGNGTQLPQQVDSGKSGAPAYEMLNLHMQLFDKTSGINDALLGQDISASTGAALYEARVRNSTTILTDLLDSFSSFTEARNQKARSII